MRRLLLGICLIVGCGDASSQVCQGAQCARQDGSEGLGGTGGAGGFGERCSNDEDCDEGSVCKPYEKICVTPVEPVPCEPGEVLVELDLIEIFDRNGTPYPHTDVEPVEVFTNEEDVVYQTGSNHPVSLGAAFAFNVFEDGDPLKLALEFHIVNFEVGDFEVDFNGEMAASFSFECAFSAEELVENAGEIGCEQTDGYNLVLTYDVDTAICS